MDRHLISKSNNSLDIFFIHLGSQQTQVADSFQPDLEETRLRANQRSSYFITLLFPGSPMVLFSNLCHGNSWIVHIRTSIIFIRRFKNGHVGLCDVWMLILFNSFPTRPRSQLLISLLKHFNSSSFFSRTKKNFFFSFSCKKMGFRVCGIAFNFWVI